MYSYLAKEVNPQSASSDQIYAGLVSHLSFKGSSVLLIFAEQLSGSLEECARRIMEQNKAVPLRASVGGLFVLQEGYVLHTASDGTVVVWTNPDRLTYRGDAQLKDHLVEDFGVTYRYLLVTEDDPLELIVHGKKVQAVDPLFLTPGALYYLPPEENGAQLIDERTIPVLEYRDPDTGERHFRRALDEEELDRNDPNLLGVYTFQYRSSAKPGVGCRLSAQGARSRP